MPVDILLKYFPEISDIQMERFQKLEKLYPEFNEKVNVISRKDIEYLMEKHVLHSLSIAKFFKFEDNSNIIDIGTGGGFPGIPLAIFFDRCIFTLIDSIGKKIRVVQEIADTLELKNVKALQMRSEQFNGNFDYIVSRAVTALPAFLKQSKHLVKNGKGIIYLKGGNFDEELKELKKPFEVYKISDYFKEEFFETKKVVYIIL